MKNATHFPNFRKLCDMQKKPGYMILQSLISYMYHWSYSIYTLKLYILVHLIRIAGLEE